MILEAFSLKSERVQSWASAHVAPAAAAEGTAERTPSPLPFPAPSTAADVAACRRQVRGRLLLWRASGVDMPAPAEDLPLAA